MNSPNFLIIGCNKGGTTSLFQYLKEHPEVFMPRIKEPMFFNYYQKTGEDGAFRTQKVIKSFPSYRKIFEGSEAYKVSGEASTSYLANPYCAANIYDFNPTMKLIAILRNPIERAFSNYLMYVRWGEEKRTFKNALKDEMEGKELPQGKQYIYLGRYLKSLQIYSSTFGEEQIKVLLYDDLKSSPHQLFKEVCGFLNIDDSFTPNLNKRFNTNDAVEIRPIYRNLKRLDRKFNFSKILPNSLKKKIHAKPTMKAREKQKLIDLYNDEILGLSEFLQRDLNHWLK
ncbi:MAG: hypothetical protein CMC70_03205 [Flavobacteriaceae bacterium]|nr:hypothetical protein [Flavobacteriaceae bacterium]